MYHRFDARQVDDARPLQDIAPVAEREAQFEPCRADLACEGVLGAGQVMAQQKLCALLDGLLEQWGARGRRHVGQRLHRFGCAPGARLARVDRAGEGWATGTGLVVAS